MRNPIAHTVVLGLSLLLVSCGGSDIVAEPLIDSSVVGSYDGTEFIPINGYATVVTTSSGDAAAIVLGTGPVGCGSESANEPPRGYTAAVRLPALAVGSYSNVYVQLYRNTDDFEGAGQNSGTVTISSVTDESVVGEISFQYTDSDDREFSVTGTFELAHCAY